MIRRTLLPIAVFGACSLIFLTEASAVTEMAFSAAKTEYANLKKAYQNDIKAVEAARDQEIAKIDDQIKKLNGTLKACPTYTCIQETKRQIRQAEKEKASVVYDAERDLYPLMVDFVIHAKALAVASFSYEFKAAAAKLKELGHFTPGADTTCDVREERSGRMRQYASRQMICRQMNVEYQYKGVFYSVKMAMGLRYNGMNHVGTPQKISSAELEEVETVFGMSPVKFMEGVSPIFALTGDPKYSTFRPSWVQEDAFGYYGMEFYHMFSGVNVGTHVVSTDQASAPAL